MILPYPYLLTLSLTICPSLTPRLALSPLSHPISRLFRSLASTPPHLSPPSFQELEKYEKMDEDDLEAIRERRLKQMQKLQVRYPYDIPTPNFLGP